MLQCKWHLSMLLWVSVDIHTYQLPGFSLLSFCFLLQSFCIVTSLDRDTRVVVMHAFK